MSDVVLASMRNGESLARDAVPSLSIDAFRSAVISAPDRVSALFGAPARDGQVELWAVLAGDGDATLRLARTTVEGGSFPSMTPERPEVHLFEREIAERWKLTAEGHPWPKPVRFTPASGGSIGVMDFYRVEGDEVHEVAVGPVHAGVIEPGHFRFQCHGETVFHLEISLGYQHRGVERALEGGPHTRSLHHVETLAGDTSAAHATAYCEVVEALSTTAVSPRASALRAVAIELERLANHTGTLGALAGDVAFLPTAAFCGRIRGDFLNLTASLCGSRFGRGIVRPGGVAFDVDDALAKAMLARLDAAMRDVEEAVELMMRAPSVQARFEDTGRVDSATAASLGLVGVAARASGLLRDVRNDHPTGAYRASRVSVSAWPSGDVFARAFVRHREVQRAGAFVKEQLSKLPAGALRETVGALAPDRVGVALVEGFRGEVCHVALTDGDGRFAAYKVVDPSFHNWMGLAMALRGQAISDFPLCNKSFDLSYCGFDL